MSGQRKLLKKAEWLVDNVSVPLGIVVQDGESYRVLKPCFYNIDLDEWYWNGYRIMAGKIIKWFYNDEEDFLMRTHR